MLSIDWSEVPIGYDWAIQDYDGCIKVFNERPDSSYEDGWQSESGRYIFIAWGHINPKWLSTIVKRPR